MSPVPQVLQFLVVAVAGWINQQQRDVIDYLQEENRVRREQLGPGRLLFTDAQRRRLTVHFSRLKQPQEVKKGGLGLAGAGLRFEYGHLPGARKGFLDQRFLRWPRCWELREERREVCRKSCGCISRTAEQK